MTRTTISNLQEIIAGLQNDIDALNRGNNSLAQRCDEAEKELENIKIISQQTIDALQTEIAYLRQEAHDADLKRGFHTARSNDNTLNGSEGLESEGVDPNDRVPVWTRSFIKQCLENKSTMTISLTVTQRQDNGAENKIRIAARTAQGALDSVRRTVSANNVIGIQASVSRGTGARGNIERLVKGTQFSCRDNVPYRAMPDHVERYFSDLKRAGL